MLLRTIVIFLRVDAILEKEREDRGTEVEEREREMRRRVKRMKDLIEKEKWTEER